MGRTGTNSQKKVLELLGYKVLHSKDLMAYGLEKEYIEALTG